MKQSDAWLAFGDMCEKTAHELKAESDKMPVPILAGGAIALVCLARNCVAISEQLRKAGE